MVLAYWQAMNSNDFAAASLWLAEDFRNIAPQSAEVICGRDNFVAVNANYPANGRWVFVVNTVVQEAQRVVTDVSISDGVVSARAITFHTVANDLIVEQTEYWPDDYPAPAWRREWVELL